MTYTATYYDKKRYDEMSNVSGSDEADSDDGEGTLDNVEMPVTQVNQVDEK